MVSWPTLMLVKQQLRKEYYIILERVIKLEKNKKNGDKDSILEYELVETLMNTLNKGKRININDFDNSQKRIISNLNLISSKPVIYVLNLGDNQIDTLKIEELKKINIDVNNPKINE